MKIITTTTKKLFEMKMDDMEKEGYFIEYKEDKPFWKKRIDNLLKEYDLRGYGFLGELPEIVFLMGNKPYRFRVCNIFYEKDIPQRYKDAVKTDGVFAFKCVPMRYSSSCVLFYLDKM